MKYRILLILGMALLWGCGKKSTEPGELKPSIYFAPDTISVAKAGEASIQLKLGHMNRAIFGLSLRIQYAPILVAVADSTDFTIGDYFGEDAVSFVNVRSDSIYLTISMTRGKSEVTGSGNLGAFTLTGVNKGTGELVIVPSALRFYDSAGDTVSVPGIEIKHAIVSVR